VLNQPPRHEDLLDNGIKLHSFLTLALDGGTRSPSRPNRFTLGEKVPVNRWTEGWVGPRAGQDIGEKTPLPMPGIESRFLGRIARSLVAIPTELSWLR
jgi:hypothetical protein